MTLALDQATVQLRTMGEVDPFREVVVGQSLTIDDFFRVVCEGIPKAKRFSTLSQLELIDLWKQLAVYVGGQMCANRSINIPGIGGLHYVQKTKRGSDDVSTTTTMPHFVPSKSWEKLPGYQPVKQPVQGGAAFEPLNFAAVAHQSGFSRDDVETALKDVIHGLFRVLKRGGSVVLPFGNLGKLYFRQREVRMRFFPEFVSAALNEITSSKAASELQEETQQSAATADESSTTQQESVETSNETGEKSNTTDEQAAKPRSPNGRAMTPTSEADESPQREEDPELYIGFSLGVHTHPHSGDRLWTDAKCPVCRQARMPVVVLREQMAKKDKERDRMLLKMSLAVDSEHQRLTREFELGKLRAAVTTAQYNHSKAIEKEEMRKKENRNLPMGDLYENRTPPPDRVLNNKVLADGVREQIAQRARTRYQERLKKEHDDQLSTHRFVSELKAAEIEAHLEKLRKRQQQQEALAEQIMAQHQQRNNSSEPMSENPFARSENLMFLYKKEKAKQLYQEQLAIMKQKKEYEAKVAEIERKEALDQLALCRRELEKDVKNVKLSNFEARKHLESYWGEQVRLKNRLYASSGMNQR